MRSLDAAMKLRPVVGNFLFRMEGSVRSSSSALFDRISPPQTGPTTPEAPSQSPKGWDRPMPISVKAFALTAGLFLGGSTCLIACLNLADPSYGGEYLAAMSSVYPGFEHVRTFQSVAIGTLYGLVDGAFAGFLFAWIYNALGRRLQ